MNRPFGAVDVSANLKGTVPKTAAQKILVALAERGDLVQKTCGAHILTYMRSARAARRSRRQNDVFRGQPGQP